MTDKTTATPETVDNVAAIGSRVQDVVRPGYGVKRIEGLLCWLCAGKIMQCRSKRSLVIWCTRCGERVEQGQGMTEEEVWAAWGEQQRRCGPPVFEDCRTNARPHALPGNTEDDSNGKD